MSTTDIINSGDLELYVYGILNEGEMNQIANLSKIDSILKNEIVQIEKSILNLSSSFSPILSSDVYQKIKNQIDLKEGKVIKMKSKQSGLSYIGWAASIALLFGIGYQYNKQTTIENQIVADANTISESVTPTTTDNALVPTVETAAPRTTTAAPAPLAKPTSPVVTTPKPPVTAPKLTMVTYNGRGFSPKEITIVKGSTVRFLNTSDDDMWIVADLHPLHNTYPEKSKGGCSPTTFDMCKAIGNGKYWDFTFSYEGTFGYHNESKPVMNGQIEVNLPGEKPSTGGSF